MIGKLKILFWTGIVLLFLPNFGLPDFLKTIFTVVIGMLVIFLAVKLKHGYKKMKYELRHVEKETEPIIHE